MTWADVQLVHRTQKGIYVLQDRIVSILCSQTKDARYADEVRDDYIRYCVNSGTSQKGVRLLEVMAGTDQTLRVYEKVAVNNWFDHGMWQVFEKHRHDSWTMSFILRRPRS